MVDALLDAELCFSSPLEPTSRAAYSLPSTRMCHFKEQD